MNTSYINKMFPQASISTRTETAISKPPVFHQEAKRKLQLQNKHKTGNFLKGKRKNVSNSNTLRNNQNNTDYLEVTPCKCIST